MNFSFANLNGCCKKHTHGDANLNQIRFSRPHGWEEKAKIFVILFVIFTQLASGSWQKWITLHPQQHTTCLAILPPTQRTLIPTLILSVAFPTLRPWRTARHCSTTTSPPSRCISGLRLLWPLSARTCWGASPHETSLFLYPTPQPHVVIS